jgi:hypothetical protein
MPRYIIKEGVLDKLFGGIFSAIGKGQAKRVIKVLKFDPVLQKLTKDADDIYDDMRDHIQKSKKNDPELRKLLKKYGY